jgi:hypothetical protein
VEQIRKDIK